MPFEPARPNAINFVRIREPGRPVELTWVAPHAEVAGYKLYATDNPFPAEMAGPLFAGQMRQFVDEQTLGPGETSYRAARADNFYAMVWYDVDDNYYVVDGLQEPQEAAEIFIDVTSMEATQPRTYLRVRWVPPPVDMRDREVHVFVRDVAPNKSALGRMASGATEPDFVLPPRGDGFIDTVTEVEWRKHYVALAVARDGSRRPLDLTSGGFLRLEAPNYLEREGARKAANLFGKVCEQLQRDLERRSITADDMRERFERADNLSPFDPSLQQLKDKAAERYGETF